MNVIAKNKFFFSLLSLLIAIIALILISTVFLYINSVEGKIREINHQFNDILLGSSKSSVEDYLYSINKIGNQVYTNNSILNLINDSENLTSKEKIFILDWLTQLKNSTSNIHSVSLYISDENKIYDTNYGYSHYFNYPDREWIRRSNSSKGNRMLTIRYRELIGSNNDESLNKDVISFIYTLPPFSKGSNKLSININLIAIYDETMEELKGSGDYFFAILNKDNSLLIGDRENRIYQELSSMAGELSYSTSRLFHTLKVDDVSYSVTQVPSESFPLNFIWIESNRNVRDFLSEMRRSLILGVSLVGLFVLVFALFIAWKTTRTMDEIIQLIDYQSSNILFVADFKEFITQTLNDNSIMNEKLEAVTNIYRDNMLNKLLDNRNFAVSECLEQLERFDVSFGEAYVFVISIEIVNVFSLEEDDSNLNLIKQTIRQSSEKLFEEKGIVVHGTNFNRDTIALIISSFSEDWLIERKIIDDLSGEILSVKTEKHPVRASLGISDKTSDISQVRTLFQQSVKALQYRDLKAERNILYFSDLEKFKKYNYFSLSSDSFEADLMRGNSDVCLYDIKSTFSELEEGEKILKNEFEQLVLNYLSIMLRVAFKSNIDISDNKYLNGNIVNLTLSIKTIYSAKEILGEITSYICKEINASHSDNDSLYLKNILSYIDENFSLNLSMDDVSAATNLSASYIYKIMKRNTHMTFVEYLTNKKIKRACELLHQNWKVKDVAEEVGYSNAKYFISVFKKKTGVTPAMYKNGAV
ncbi:MAG: AraC family transcriptional regulator [Spirochaetales bacterium]|nr:AraC family transcriptional regulator [Spirochaetales bacterium]